jgi:hypothetical protein
MYFQDNCHFARHVETSKNALGLHGNCDEINPTQWTDRQIHYLVNYCKDNNLKNIFFGSTKQCEYTANKLSELLNVNKLPLELEPIDLKEFSGLSHHQLIASNPELARAMELFRFRIASFKETNLTKISDPLTETEKLLEWKRNQTLDKFHDALCICTSSLLVKIANLNCDVLPNMDFYKNIGVANAGIIDFNKWSPHINQWPKIEYKSISTPYGNLVLAEYLPTISPYNTITTIIYPGTFGASRFGPYNLFNRLARTLAEKGIRAIVCDPIGSGESEPCYRSLETELVSIDAIISEYIKHGPLAICAHSLSANLIHKHVSSINVKKYLLSPLLDMVQRHVEWNAEGTEIFRHGLLYSTDFLVDDSYQDFSHATNSEFFFGTNDQYVDCSQFIQKNYHSKCHVIQKAGHNFSEGNSSNELISLLVDRIINYFWELTTNN